MRFQQVLELSQEPIDRGRVEQVGVVLQGERQPLVLFGRDQRQVELRRAHLERQQLEREPAQVEPRSRLRERRAR